MGDVIVDMIYDKDGNQLEFLDILSLASSIVTFKSIGEAERRNKEIDRAITELRQHLFAVEDKIDTILNILQEK